MSRAETVTDSPSARRIWSAEVRDRWFAWNNVALALDGGFFGAAMSVVSADSVQTTLVRALGGPNWLVSLMPSMMMIGFMGSPILTVRWVERLRLYKRPVALVSIAQRLPALAAAIALFLWAGTRPTLALAVVALTPLVSGFVGGLTLSAFWQLVAKILPEGRRSSSLAFRNLVATVLGFLGGILVKVVLARWPGFEGYAVLYLLQFLLLMASFAAFVAIRELPSPRHEETRQAPDSHPLCRVREAWRSTPCLKGFVTARVLGLGLLVATPFLAIHARSVTQAPLDAVGSFVSAQMLGAVAGNLVGGPFGDRSGGRKLAMLACALLSGSMLLAAVGSSVPAFLASFALIGAGNTLLMNGSNTLQLSVFRERDRPVAFAVVSSFVFPGYLAAAAAATAIRELGWGFPAAAWTAAGLLLLAMLQYRLLPEGVRPESEDS
ncbi:MAG: MFS transporter [Fimbriimonadaceae bacterium]